MLRRPGAVARGRLVGVGHEAKPARAPVAPHDDAARHAPKPLEMRPELAVAARVREAAHEELAVADVEVRGWRRAVRELPPCSLRSRRRGAPLRRPPRRAVVVGIGPAEAVPDLARRRPTGRSARRSRGGGGPRPPEPLGRPAAWRAPHVVAWRRTAVVRGGARRRVSWRVAWRAPHVVAWRRTAVVAWRAAEAVVFARRQRAGRRHVEARVVARFRARGPRRAAARRRPAVGRAAARRAPIWRALARRRASESVVAWRRAAVGAARRRRTEAVARWAPHVVARRRAAVVAWRAAEAVARRPAARRRARASIAGPVAARRAPPVITARRARRRAEVRGPAGVARRRPRPAARRRAPARRATRWRRPPLRRAPARRKLAARRRRAPIRRGRASRRRAPRAAAGVGRAASATAGRRRATLHRGSPRVRGSLLLLLLWLSLLDLWPLLRTLAELALSGLTGFFLRGHRAKGDKTEGEIQDAAKGRKRKEATRPKLRKRTPWHHHLLL